MYGDQSKQEKILRKKISYEVNEQLGNYLLHNAREIDLPIRYDELTQYDTGIPVLDKNGDDTLWLTAIYSPNNTHRIHTALKDMYSILRTEGYSAVHRHLHIDRVDYCTFGNSNPFRIKIANNLNDNYDYFYIKKADASRIYGLEIEHILSPSRINYFVDNNTLLEDHIAGVPGDVFIDKFLKNKEYNKVRIAKELVKFNERSFVQLLGDMRSYNYVFDITPDFEDIQFRIRAIDFDQQCYEGKKSLYLPQFYKENYPLVKLVQQHLTLDAVEQYQKEERTQIARRSKLAHIRLNALLTVMEHDTISVPENIYQLRHDLAEHYEDDGFLQCTSMGAILRRSIAIL